MAFFDFPIMSCKNISREIENKMLTIHIIIVLERIKIPKTHDTSIPGENKNEKHINTTKSTPTST